MKINEEYPNEIFGEWKVTVGHADGKGRILRAVSAFAVGDLIVEDEGIPVVLADTDMTASYCHECFMPHDKMINCKGCQLWSVCAGCARAKLRDHHQGRCALFAELPAVAKSAGTDVNMLRILLQVMLAAAEVRGAQPDSLDAAAAARLARRALALKAIGTLHADPDAFPSEWHFGIRRGGEGLIEAARKHLPAAVLAEDAEGSFAGYDVDQLLKTALRINLTSFGLPDMEGRNSNFGAGLFPIFGLLSHSCVPNAVFSSIGHGRMALRAIRPIKANGEIAVSYVDLFQSRQQRRMELFQTKHFMCQCARCTDEAYAAFPQDRFLDFPLCPRCTQEVAIPEEYFNEDDEPDSGSLADDMLRQDDRRVKAYHCSDCKTLIDADDVEEPLVECAQMIRDADELYQHRRFAEAASVFERIVKTYEKAKLIHASYVLIFGIYAPLVNCYRRTDQLPQSAAALRRLVKIMENNPAIAEHHPEKGDFYWNLGETFSKLVSRGGASPAVMARYRQEERECYSRAAEIRTMCYGPKHFATLEAKAALDKL